MALTPLAKPKNKKSTTAKQLTIKGEKITRHDATRVEMVESSFGTWAIYTVNREIGELRMIYVNSKTEAFQVYKAILDFLGRAK